MTTKATQVWDGTDVDSGYVAFVVFASGTASPSTTTPLIAAASNGQGAWIVPPARIGDFLRVHAAGRLVCHGAGELHRLLHDHLASDAGVQQILWKAISDGRLSDISLLDQLLRLAQTGSSRPRRLSLAQLAKEHADFALAKGDELQLLIASVSPAVAPTHPALAAEAGCRAHAVTLVFNAMWQQALAAGLISSNPADTGQFDLPSLSLQVKGDVALAHVQSNGLYLAPLALKKIEAGLLAAQKRSEARLRTDKGVSQCFKLSPGHKSEVNLSRLPKVKHKALQTWLAGMLATVRGLHATDFSSPRGQDGGVSAVPEDWEPLVRSDPLLRAWFELMTISEVSRTCVPDGSSPLRPSYEVLPRIHSRKPDLAALRRTCGPDLFRPTLGHQFLVVELRDLELRALAAVCQRRYGKSKLAEIYSGGENPSHHTAAALARLAPADFGTLPTKDPQAHDRWLRVAEALLVAAPQGFSTEGVREVARAEFGLDDLGLAEVQSLHGMLLNDILPELGQYLGDDTIEVLANNLRRMPQELSSPIAATKRPHGPSMPEFRGWFREDKRVRPGVREQLLLLLRVWNGNETLRPLISQGVFNNEFNASLFGRKVTTLTGRAGGRMLFPEARQAEYLDVADDAVKAALFELVANEFKVVALADHDIVMEISEAEASSAMTTQATKLVRQAVEDVLVLVPVLCGTSPRLLVSASGQRGRREATRRPSLPDGHMRLGSEYLRHIWPGGSLAQ